MLFPDPQDPKGRGLAAFTEHMRARGGPWRKLGQSCEHVAVIVIGPGLARPAGRSAALRTRRTSDSQAQRTMASSHLPSVSSSGAPTRSTEKAIEPDTAIEPPPAARVFRDR
jgi:hypothetical protein